MVRPFTKYADFSFSDLVFSAFVARVEIKVEEPANFEEAISLKESSKWIEIINEEMTSLKAIETWTLVPKLENQKLVQCKWIFKLKKGIKAFDHLKYKARLIGKCFTQSESIDSSEIFSHVVKFKTI